MDLDWSEEKSIASLDLAESYNCNDVFMIFAVVVALLTFGAERNRFVVGSKDYKNRKTLEWS